MFRLMFVVSCFYVALTQNLAQAHSEEQAESQKQFQMHVKACAKDNGLTEEDYTNLMAQVVPTPGTNSGCFLACLMRLIDVMDDDGMIATELPANSSINTFRVPDMRNRFEDFIKLCSKVNSMDISDGKKGCERALLAFECSKDAKIMNFGIRT